MRVKQVQYLLLVLTLFCVVFGYFIYVNSNLYIKHLTQMFNSLTKNNLNLQENYINILRYNLNIQTNPELVKNKCNYDQNGPRILCAVFTRQMAKNTKLKAVHDTWAKR